MQDPSDNKKHSERLREEWREHTEDSPPGIVIVIDKDKRYGIIKTGAGRDIYFTDKTVPDSGFDRIEIGSAVRYVDQPSEHGPRASIVEIVERKD